MRVEDQFTDVLQNIEFSIVKVYRSHRNLYDYNAQIVLEAIIDEYIAEKISREPKKVNFTDLELLLKSEVKKMCERGLGRNKIMDNMTNIPKPISIDELTICIKRILKSIKRWNKVGGRQGYLEYIEQFII